MLGMEVVWHLACSLSSGMQRIHRLQSFSLVACLFLILLSSSLAQAANPTTIRTPAASAGTINDTLLCSVTNVHRTKTVTTILYLDGNDVLLPPTALAPGESLSLAMDGTPLEASRGYCEAQVWGSARWVAVTLEVQQQGTTMLVLTRQSRQINCKSVPQ